MTEFDIEDVLTRLEQRKEIVSQTVLDKLYGLSVATGNQDLQAALVELQTFINLVGIEQRRRFALERELNEVDLRWCQSCADRLFKGNSACWYCQGCASLPTNCKCKGGTHVDPRTRYILDDYHD